MKRLLVVFPALLLFCANLMAADKEEDRLKQAGEVLSEILNIPDNIPHSILDRSECVIVFPSVKKLAIGIGGSYGRGAMSCRSGENFTGPWGPPALYALEGGNIGFQLGGQETDFVLAAHRPREIWVDAQTGLPVLAKQILAEPNANENHPGDLAAPVARRVGHGSLLGNQGDRPAPAGAGALDLDRQA